jgi:hypothetical protein
MATLRIIDDFTAGTTYAVVRTVNAPSNGIDSPSDAWLTVKTNMTDNDAMSQFKIHITASGTGNGLIVVNADRSSTLNFIVNVSDSYNMAPLSTFFYDIKIKMLPTLYVYTLETGKLFTTESVTNLPSS